MTSTPRPPFVPSPIAQALAPKRPKRPRRLLGWVAGAALMAWAGAAVAGAGTAALNVFATLRGHQGPADQPYGPLERQRFDLYRPGTSISESDRRTGAPLVIFIYGGSWDSGHRREYRFAGEALAAQGFTVMVVDYRLYPEVRYPDFLQDCAKAVAYGLDHAAELGADPHRVFLYGHSAGAYNVAMLALDPRWLRAVGHAPADLAGWIGLAGPYNFLPIGDPGVQEVFDWPNTSPDTQPINHAADLAHPLPVFFGVSTRDTFVDPVQNTASLEARLRERGAPVTSKAYDHVNHATLIGSLSWPLTPLSSVLDDTAAFIRATPPVAAQARVADRRAAVVPDAAKAPEAGAQP